jgi:hypothetical protein
MLRRTDRSLLSPALRNYLIRVAQVVFLASAIFVSALPAAMAQDAGQTSRRQVVKQG